MTGPSMTCLVTTVPDAVVVAGVAVVIVVDVVVALPSAYAKMPVAVSVPAGTVASS